MRSAAHSMAQRAVDPQQERERAFVNARIWTGDTMRPSATAMLARGERLVLVGEDADVLAAAKPDAERIDLGGRRVLPGFIDAHCHFTTDTAAGLYNSGTVVEMQRRLLALAAASPGDGWIHDGGWAYSEFPDAVPHRKYIDDILPDRPVWITARDGHMGLANTVALERGGIGVKTRNPRKGRIVRDARGEPTGELRGLALYAVQNLIPPPSIEACEAHLTDLLARAAACGITSLQNLQGWSPNELEAVVRACRTGRITARFYASVWLDTSPSGARSPKTPKRLATEFGTLLKFGAAKAVLDGVIDAGTAAMREPLTNGANGFSYFSQERLNALVVRAEKRNMQVMLHACGDAAICQALTAIEHAASVNGALAKGRRHRIEHCDIPSDEDLRRMRALGVVVCSQPNFAYPDDTNLFNYSVLLGPERTRRSQSYRRIDDAGIVQAFSSDYPVSSMDVLRSVHTAVTRRTRLGTPAEGWNANQAIAVEAALRHFTRDAAFAGFDEHDKGVLAPGLLADFVVLSHDILEGDPRTLLDAEVEQTVMGGKTVFRRGDDCGRATNREAPMLSPSRSCPHCRWQGLAATRSGKERHRRVGGETTTRPASTE